MPKDLVIPIPMTAVDLYDGGEMGAILDKIEKECKKFVPDLSTRKGREEVKQRAIEEERQRVEDEKRRAEEEQRKREENKRIRTRTQNAAILALVEKAGLKEQAARKAVDSIDAGQIPKITITY